MQQKGKLIVIEGSDGSGKTTQTKKLIERLRQENKPVETFHFPRHQQKFFGLMVDQYLNNEFGDAAKLDPHIASLFYACDRWEVKDMLNSWLEQGKTIVLERYATSNMGHQAGKIADLKERDKFLDWLDELEFKTFKIPRPDLVVYLNVRADIASQLMASRKSDDKKYIKGKLDGHENNHEHLKAASEAYLYIYGKYDYWKKIECVRDGKLLSIDEIHELVWEEIGNV